MKSLCAAALLLGLSPVVALAIPVQSSVGTLVTARTCVAGANGPCEFITPILHSEADGLPGGLAADALIDIDGFGLATSTISLSGIAGAPSLSTSAHSDPGSRVSTNSFALQRYVYDGAVATTRTFGGTLNYTQSVVDPNNPLYVPLGTASGISASILLFTSSDVFAEAGTTAEDNYFNLFGFAIGAATGYNLIAQDAYSDHAAGPGGGVASLSVTVSLNPGDAFWIYTLLQTPAGNGSFVETSTPWLTGWDDPTGLVPANVAPIAEPASLALLLIGALAFVVVRRRHQTR